MVFEHSDKVKFLHTIDVLSVPTTYREPKGLYVLEALANGVPVVQPRHGSFDEFCQPFSFIALVVKMARGKLTHFGLDG